ncbi:hypothetical protein N9165_00090 [Akkermansiaceae bacterium]|nr:hypothetical protein [Akkermansiaceae bacterium]
MLHQLRSLKRGRKSWKDSLPVYEADPSLLGTKLLVRGLDVSPAENGALVELVTEVGPKMLRRALDDLGGMIPPTQQMSQRLETVKHNLAARETWELFKDFDNREEEIQKHMSLGLVTVRELSGIWSLRISLKGQR